LDVGCECRALLAAKMEFCETNKTSTLWRKSKTTHAVFDVILLFEVATVAFFALDVLALICVLIVLVVMSLKLSIQFKFMI
jgi:hypothetical protein